MLLEDAQKVSRFDRDMLADITDKQDSGVMNLSGLEQRCTKLSRQQAGFVDDEDTPVNLV